MNNRNQKAAEDYALNQALQAAGNNYLENRPDPNTDRIGYESWYYSLNSAQQQAEWDIYYKQEEQRRHIAQKNIQNSQGGHAVSREYAHSHMVPERKPKMTSNSVAADKRSASGNKYHPKDTNNHPAIQPALSDVQRTNPIDHSVVGPDKHREDIIEAVSRSSKTDSTQKKTAKKANPFKPLIAAAVVGSVVMLLAYNQVVFAQVKQYIRPGSQLNTPVIVSPDTNPCIGQTNNINIPKINTNSPVVYDEKSWDNSKIDKALERGVVHYGTTAVPGQAGNNVILGHSSGNFLNGGDFKYEFVLLDALEENDTFTICYQQKRYVYKIFRKEIIDPTDLTYIYPQQEGVPGNSNHITTLVTCHPPGTNWKRLIIQGVQISPTPSINEESTELSIEDLEITEVPSNSRSFWRSILDWF